MVKVLLLAIFAFAIYLWLSGAAARRQRGDTPSAKAQEDMVTCARCGVHLPQSDSVSANGQYFCCDEHRLAGPA